MTSGRSTKNRRTWRTAARESAHQVLPPKGSSSPKTRLQGRVTGRSPNAARSPNIERCARPALGRLPAPAFDWLVEVGFKPGVTDNVGNTAREAVRDVVDREQRTGESGSTPLQYLLSGRKLTREDAWRLFDVNLRQTFYNADVLTTSLELANAVKLNDEELPVVARLCGLRSAMPADLLRALCDRFGLRLAALTRGPAGSLVVSAEGAWDARAPIIDVIDTVGAGDAVPAA